jgi:acetate kinase
LEWVGLRLDQGRNQALVGVEGGITPDGSTLPAYVIPTDEELLIARDTVEVVLQYRSPK